MRSSATIIAVAPRPIRASLAELELVLVVPLVVSVGELIAAEVLLTTNVDSASMLVPLLDAMVLVGEFQPPTADNLIKVVEVQ